MSFAKAIMFLWLVFSLTVTSTYAEFHITENTTKADLCNELQLTGINCTCANLLGLCKLLDVYVRNGSVIYPETRHTYKCNRKMGLLRGVSNAIIGLVGVLGNGLVIVIYVKYARLTARCHTLIALLAIADFITCVLRLWRNIPYFWSCFWMYDLFWCKCLTGLLNGASYVSMGMLVLIAVERYFGIVHPFRSGLSMLQTAALITLNVVVGVAASVPIFMHTKVTNGKQCKLMWPSRSKSMIYTGIVSVFFTIIPAITLGLLYWKIIKTLKESTQNLLKSNAMPISMETKRIRDNNRIMAIVVMISILFVATVFPNRVLWIVRDVLQRNKSLTKQFDYFFVFFSYIVYSLHAVVNPIIYSLMDRPFRRRVVALFKCHAVPRNKTDFARTTATRSYLDRLSTFREGSKYHKHKESSINQNVSTTRNL